MRKRRIGRPRTRFPQAADYERVMSLGDAAECIGVSYDSFRRAVYEHGIPVLRHGRNILIMRHVVERIIQAGTYEIAWEGSGRAQTV